MTAALSLAGCVTVPHGLIGRDGPDTAARVARAVPDGSTRAVAAKTMTAAGYKCRESSRFAWSDTRTLTQALVCEAIPGVSRRGGFAFSDEYDVVFELKGDRTILVGATVNASGL